jgi:hypothetical protein
MHQMGFPPDVLAQVSKGGFEHPQPAVCRRMEMLWLIAQGWMHERIAELSCVSRPTVQRVFDKYRCIENGPAHHAGARQRPLPALRHGGAIRPPVGY